TRRVWADRWHIGARTPAWGPPPGNHRDGWRPGRVLPGREKENVMAEIEIERNRHSTLFTWALALVLLVVIVLGAASAAASHHQQRPAAPVHRTGAEAADV